MKQPAQPTPADPASELKSDRKSPGFWFYTADYERDVQMLSLSAQGLWMRMLCWMSDNEAHRGFLELPTGQPMTNWDIGAKVGKTIREVQKAIAEMEHIGIFSRDDRSCIFCRRMARESHISDVRRKAAASRLLAAKRAADGTFAGNFAGANRPAKDEQKPAVPASASDPVSVLLNPPTTPHGGLFPDEAPNVQAPTLGSGLVRPTAPARNKKPAPAISARQQERFREYLSLHPKNTIQTVSARNLWAEKVTEEDCANWIIAQLKRERAGDTTYMLGPGKWLAQHLELWAAGVKANGVDDEPPGPSRPRLVPKGDSTDRLLEDFYRQERANAEAKANNP